MVPELTLEAARQMPPLYVNERRLTVSHGALTRINGSPPGR